MRCGREIPIDVGHPGGYEELIQSAPESRRPPGATMQTKENDLLILSPAIAVIARILFSLIFFLSGITHFTAMRSYVALMPPAIPWRAFWVIISAIVELAGAALILFNYRPRLGGWLLVAFLIPVTI